ncbi:hypothetical protein [Bradyrhizobium sp. Ec3.3]|uniref:hypothetical protein n=1 Tax=Bradyrhizobium sp. Ec3.3 TaxID=189753 RepID=UPI0012EB5E77|nr:hypothetical protein [Bradyrhizobium sp. Ec3.3]
MRLFLVAFFALSTGLTHAHAEEKTKQPVSSCSYTLRSGDSYVVPAGEALCWRVPAPSYKEYTLLNCESPPALQEIVRVKLGDPRCKKYEERQ